MSTHGATSAGTGAGAGHNHTHDRSPAEWFCRIVGPVLILAGLAGFLVNASFGTGDGVDGDSLLGFEVNGWHNLVHIATGALLLAGAKGREKARAVALTFGIAYLVVTLYGLIDGNDVIRLVPINSADNVLHIVLTAGAIGAALATKRLHDTRSARA